MYRFGATTIARWLTEELPEGVRAFIEDSDTLHELVGLEATSGRLVPRIKVQRVWGGGTSNVLRDIRLNMDTPVILTQGESLTGATLTTISSQICRAATDSHALTRSRVEARTADNGL